MKRLICLTTLLIISFANISQAADKANLRSVYRLMDQKNYESAVDKLETLVARYPKDADARYQYGLALLRNNQFDDSIKANKALIELAPSYQKYANFNIGIAYAGLGKDEKAVKLIQKSMHDGYINYDRLKTEEGLKTIRQQGHFEFSPEQKYQEFTAYNRIKVPYTTLLPQNYDSNKTYKGMVAFPPGNYGEASADWMIEKLLDNKENTEWIITVVLAPENGLINHPSHHALNDLMKHQRKQFKLADNKFHFLGYHSGGSPAATYSQMSSSYVNGLTTIGNYYWENWSDSNLADFDKVPTHLFVGEKDLDGIRINQKVYDIFKKSNEQVKLKIFDGNSARITDLENGMLFKYLK